MPAVFVKVLQAATLVLWIVSLVPVPASAAPPDIVGGFDSHSTATPLDFATNGNRGYLVTKRGYGPEFFILDVHDPAGPVVLGTLDLPDDVSRIALRNDLAYLATSIDDRELVIVDVSAPASPKVVGKYDAASSRDAIAVEVGESVLFLGTRRSSSKDQHELQVLDISNPVVPVLVASVELGADVNDLVLQGNVLYAATGDPQREVVAFDVSVPSAISELASADLPGSADARGIAVHRGLIYVVRRTQADNFHILDASSLNQISAMRLLGRGEKIRIYRDRAYVAMDKRYAGLQIVDIGDPNRPRVLHSLNTEPGTNVHIDPPYTYLTGGRRAAGLVVVDTESLLRPNIVVIYTDDQNVNTTDFMPTLQELAGRGVTFRQSFVTTPVCGPSRASLLTGLYTHNHGAVLNAHYIGHGPGAIGSDQSTLATWLQSAGYRTGFFGKYINGYPHNCVDGLCNVPPGWDDWQAKALSGPNHIYYDYNISNNGTLESFGDQPEDYVTDVVAQKALGFLERQDNRPFFAILSLDAPHVHSYVHTEPAPRHVGVFAGTPPWRPLSYDEADVSDKPALFAQRARATSLLGSSMVADWMDAQRQQQLEGLLSVDEAIGDVLDTLERLGEDEDTVVIFTSDNGYYWGEHRIWGGKGFPHEESIRVPLTVSYPRLIEPGREDGRNMVLNIDLAPTIAELATAIPDARVDGQSFLPLLRGESVRGWRTDFLIEQYGNFTSSTLDAFQGIRGTTGKYAYYLNSDEEELYIHQLDPDEMESQASTPFYSLLRLQYRERIDELMTNDALRVHFSP